MLGVIPPTTCCKLLAERVRNVSRLGAFSSLLTLLIFVSSWIGKPS